MAFSFSKFSAMTKAHLPRGKTLGHMQELCSKTSAAANPVKRAAMIKTLMDYLDENCTQQTRKSIMEGCNCLGDSTIDRARRLYEQSQNMNDWLTKLNTHSIGGRYLSIKGKEIQAIYKKCYCGSVSRTKESISRTFCYCSCGWLKSLFEEVLGVPARVTLKRSIIHGDDRCELRIRIWA
jgi:hypothetical protein